MIGTYQNFDCMKVISKQNVPYILGVFFNIGLLPTMQRHIRITHIIEKYYNNDSRLAVP